MINKILAAISRKYERYLSVMTDLTVILRGLSGRRNFVFSHGIAEVSVDSTDT